MLDFTNSLGNYLGLVTRYSSCQSRFSKLSKIETRGLYSAVDRLSSFIILRHVIDAIWCAVRASLVLSFYLSFAVSGQGQFARRQAAVEYFYRLRCDFSEYGLSRCSIGQIGLRDLISVVNFRGCRKIGLDVPPAKT